MSPTDDRVIVVAGEALVDLVLGATDELRGHPGGGPFNTARTLGRLEQPVAYLGRISTDRFGRRMRDELEADGVRLDAVVATDDPTTLALAEVGAGGSATYRFYTDGTSAPGLTEQEARSALPEHVDTLHVGTLGLVLEPIATTLEALVGGAPVGLFPRGGDGALVARAGGRVAVPAPPADVVDTIGAGDAFSGGFLAWWRLRGLHPADPPRPHTVVQAT